MAFVRSISVTCPHCGKSYEVQAYGSVNAAQDPDLAERVRDGSLFVRECPSCGERNLVRSGMLYHDPDRKLMIWYLPEGVSDEGLLSDKIDAAAGSLDGYELRRVSDVGSLIEKININAVGLDDMVIEMCKYVTRMELCQKSEDRSGELAAAPFKFFRLQGADSEIVFTFPLDGAMQGVNIGFNVYEDCRGILRRNPSVAESVRGFAKIDDSWLAQFFR